MIRVATGLVLTLGLALLAVGPTLAEESPEAPDGGGLKIYTSQIDTRPFGRVTYGYDREAVCPVGRCADGTTQCKAHAACSGIGNGLCDLNQSCTDDFSPNCNPPNDTCGVAVDSMTVGAPAGQNIWELVCDPVTPGAGDCQVGFSLPDTTVSWDFSNNNTTTYPGLIKTGSSATPIDSSQTPNFNECGFTTPGAILAREDKDWPDPPNTIHTLNAVERENGTKVCMNGSSSTNGLICTGDGQCGGGTCTTTDTIWMYSVVRYEGLTGALGEGESRLCFDGNSRTNVPLWRFPNQDASGSFMERGDARWEHTAFSCETNILFPTSVQVQACSGFEGKQYSQVVNEGLVKLPSGHQFKSLVVRSSAEYCAYIVACLINVDSVRTVLYLWEVPHIGTVVRLQSNKVAQTLQDFIHVAETDVKYGPFPPLSLTSTPTGENSVDLSWDPGLITDDIDGYRIYWDTESGGTCSVSGAPCNADHPAAGNCTAGQLCCPNLLDTCDSYDFDSVNNPGQVTFNTATTATVTGLDPGTEYHFTVTTMTDYTGPTSGAVQAYESALYPVQIPAVPVDLPIETSATTDSSCSPSVEVTGVSGGKSGADVELCWSPAVDCIDGYRILGAASPEAAGNFSTEADVGPGTCATLDPTGSYFIIVGRGAGGTGPWGHFGM